MRKVFYFFTVLLFNSACLLAQVGIGTEFPTATLDVNGRVLVQKKLYLENPGSYTGEENSSFLVINNNDAIHKYNVASSSFGPINYVQFVVRNVSNQGLRGGFDTKIDAENYTLAVHGFYFLRTRDNNTNISFRKTSGTLEANRTRYVEGQQFYAYIQNGTWWLKAFVNNSQFYVGNTLANPDIYMDVIIYRNNFITKIFPEVQTVDMGRNPTKTVPLPAGF